MKRSPIYIEPAASERRHRRLEKLARELGLPMIGASLEMQVAMPDGEITHHHKQRSHSWTRNVYSLIFSQIAAVDCNDSTFGAGKVSFKDTSNVVKYTAKPIHNYTVYNYPMTYDDQGYTAGVATTANGIVVGTDDTAESFEDYRMNALIAHGAGAGQLAYMESPDYAVSWNGGTLTLTNTLYRYMNNNSGGLITVKEAGLYQHVGHNTGNWYSCMCRDVVAVPVDVPNMGQLKVTYTINLVYPV